METRLKDIRYGSAMMRRHPGFPTAGLLTLAPGIGATTAVFSIVYVSCGRCPIRRPRTI